MPFSRRSVLIGALALSLSGCPKLPGVAPVLEAARPGFQAGSRVHAFQSWSFVYVFAQGNAMGLQRAVRRIEADGLPLLRGLVESGARPRLVAETYDGGQGIQAYALHLDVELKNGRTVRIPGRQGTAEAEWRGSISQVSQATRLPEPVIEAGAGAWYGLTRVLTGLDAEAATLNRHAFALQVLKEQVQAGEKADWFDAGRPREETLSDVDMALGLIAEDVERVRSEQAILLAIVALANHAETPGALDAVACSAMVHSSGSKARIDHLPQKAPPGGDLVAAQPVEVLPGEAMDPGEVLHPVARVHPMPLRPPVHQEGVPAVRQPEDRAVACELGPGWQGRCW